MDFEEILPYLIIAAVVAICLLYVFLLHKKVNRGERAVAERDLSTRRRSIKVSRVSGFIPFQNREFYESLKTAMPSNYIILPNIAVELLFRRINRDEIELEGQYVSFGVFTTSFEPVLVIQLNDYSVAPDIVFRIPDSVKDLIRSIGIPVMEHDIRDHYNIDDLRRSIAKAMNPLYSDNK